MRKSSPPEVRPSASCQLSEANRGKDAEKSEAEAESALCAYILTVHKIRRGERKGWGLWAWRKRLSAHCPSPPATRQSSIRQYSTTSAVLRKLERLLGRAAQSSAAADSKREQRKIRKKNLPIPLFHFAREKKMQQFSHISSCPLEADKKRLASALWRLGQENSYESTLSTHFPVLIFAWLNCY